MRLAIVKLSALGDIVHAMIVLQYIKKSLPHSQITWIVDKRFEEILKHNPHIDNILSLDLKSGLKKIYQEYKRVKNIDKFDIVLDLQGLIKSAIVSKIVGKKIVGFKNPRESLASLFYTQTFDIPYEENIILRNLKLTCKALNCEIPDITSKEPFLFYKKKIGIKPQLLIIVGSSWDSKIYPKEKYIQIVKELKLDTYIAWGGEKEKKDANFIAKHTDAKVCDKMSLDELKSLISNSSLVIGGDSGPTHMAWGMNIPSITIYGPTPSQRNSFVTNINLTVDCGKKIDPNNLNKNESCIKDIPPQKIITLAKRLLNER